MEQNGWAKKESQQAAHVPHDSGMSIGSSKEEDVVKIRALEDEVRTLAEKANSASQKYADYENEIRVLQAKLRQEQRKNSAPTESNGALAATTQSIQRPGISRFGSFIGNRKNEATQQNGTSPSPAGREKELEEQLVKEQTMRIAAEKKVKEAGAEIEDLSATLFQQANEMVAAERKENSELKERIQNLEQHKQRRGSRGTDALQKENAKLKEKIKSLEQRDADRKRRLDRIEAANKRIERIRAMLQPP